MDCSEEDLDDFLLESSRNSSPPGPPHPSPASICPNLTLARCNSSGTDGPTSNPYLLSWYLQLIYTFAFAAMIVIAAGGNMVVIWIVLGHKRMRTVTNYFLVNLAVADAMITVFNTSFNFMYVMTNNWPFGKIYCKFSMFISPCAISASVFTFMAIAIDRYMVIVHPLKPRIQASSVLAMIAIIWISSVAVAFPNLPYAVTDTHYFCPDGDRTICYLLWPDGFSSTTDMGYNIFMLLVNYVIPAVALALIYARVGFELWGGQTIGERTAKHDENVKSKRKVVKMMVVVVVIFAVCWLPQQSIIIICSFHTQICEYGWIHYLYISFYWLAMSNSMYNPIIYCWMNARFRSGFKYVLRWLPCVKWRPIDATGFWGYTSSARNSGSDPTRFSYTPSSNNANGSSSLRLFTKSVYSSSGGEANQLVCRFNSDGSKGVWVFQNRQSRRRNE